MKKATALIVLLLLIVGIFPVRPHAQGMLLYYNGGVVEYTGDFYTVKIEGSTMVSDMPSIVMDNRTLVPIRALAEMLGAQVDYFAETKSAQISLNGFVIQIKLDTKDVVVNGKPVQLDVVARVYNNRTMIPLRFIAEYMNMDVGWFQSKLLITVDYARMNGVTYSEGSDYVDVIMDLGKYNNYNAFTLSNPDRIIVDIPNVKINTSASSLAINKGQVLSARWSQYNAGTSRLVIDLSAPQSYKVIGQTGKLVVRVNKSPAQDPQPTAPPTAPPTAEPPAATPTPAPSETPIIDPNAVFLKDTGKISFMISGYSAPIPQGGTLSDIYTMQTNPNGTYATISIKGKLFASDYVNFTPSGDTLLDYMSGAYNPGSDRTTVIINLKMSATFSLEYVQDESTLYITADTGAQPGTPEPGPSYISDSSITYASYSGSEEVFIYSPGFDKYTYTAYRTDPKTIVLEMDRSLASAYEAVKYISGTYIKSVKYVQISDQKVKITVSLNQSVKDSVISRPDGIAVQVYDSNMPMASYSDVGDRRALSMVWTRLTQWAPPNFLKFYSENYSPDGMVYTITYETGSGGDVGTGTFVVKDGYIDRIEISKNGIYTNVRFYGQKRLTYDVYTNYNYNNEVVDTTVTAFEKAAPGEDLIFIDPGHGGYDPGAVNGAYYEKTFNLDLSLRLKRELNAKGLKSYIIRSEDIDVGLRDRVYIANAMNASMYFCVHNNSAGSIASGTVTLYYPGDTKGQRLASLVQTEVVNELGTYDRGIVTRDDLFVLNSTDMPAALNELVFINNPEELALLLDPNFRQRAAEAMARGIIKAAAEF